MMEPWPVDQSSNRSEFVHLHMLIHPADASDTAPQFDMEIAALLKKAITRQIRQDKRAPRDSLLKPVLIRLIIVDVLIDAWHKVVTRHLSLGVIFILFQSIVSLQARQYIDINSSLQGTKI
jgi:hypothetical protein